MPTRTSRRACTCLKGRDGHRVNAVLVVASYNFGLLLRWFEALLPVLFAALTCTADKSNSREISAPQRSSRRVESLKRHMRRQKR
jgi:hypothetical protein